VSKKAPQELGSEIPGLDRATEHIVVRMRIALDDVIEGVHDPEWFIEEMRQDIRYFVWLYAKAARGES
jgi:hypothetical protein